MPVDEFTAYRSRKVSGQVLKGKEQRPEIGRAKGSRIKKKTRKRNEKEEGSLLGYALNLSDWHNARIAGTRDVVAITLVIHMAAPMARAARCTDSILIISSTMTGRAGLNACSSAMIARPPIPLVVTSNRTISGAHKSACATAFLVLQI